MKNTALMNKLYKCQDSTLKNLFFRHETELRKYASQLDRMTKEKQNM